MSRRLANRRRGLGQAVWMETLELRQLLAHFAVIGDYSSDQATAPTRDVSNLVKGWNPDFIATVGDNNYPDGAASTIDSNIGQWYHAYIGNYQGSFGGGASPNKFFPAIGNHDFSSNGGYSPYLNYFTLPGNERYYSFTDGNVQVFVINSDSHESDGTSSTSTQGQWLKSALAASTATFKLVLFHHPAYSSGSIGNNSYMQWPFQQWGASAVISGHDHDYERILKAGFPYFVDGLGGESIVGWGTTVSGSAVRYNSDYGAMLIDTSSTSMTFQFINRGGQLIDSYTLGSTSSAPSSPTGLAASAASSTQVKLTWTDNSPSLSSSFKIERSTDNGATFTPLTTTLAGVTTYTDQGLAPGATYVYRVKASNSVGDSGYSNTSTVTLPTGSTTFLSDLAWVSATNGWGPVEKDTSVGSNGAGDGNPITLNGVTYPKGLGAHANSQIVYNLNKQYSQFFSDIGVDDETGPGTVIFQVLADGVKVYDSGLMTQAGATKSISLNVANVSQLTLIVNDSGDGIDYDHADWAGARLQSAAPSQPPAAPTKLVAMAVGPTQISLTWQDVLNESGFRIERSTDNITFTPIGTVGQNVVGYSDNTVTGDTLYYYRVIATNASGDSPPSNVDFARPLQPPSPVTNLAASAASSTEIDLTWTNPNTNGEMSFIIQRSLDGSTGWTQIANVPEAESYADKTVQPNTKYFYRIDGVNPAGDSGFSNIANTTTPQVQQTAPNAPTGLAASAVSTSQVSLTWTESSTNQTGFVLERSTDNFVSNVTQIATPAATATSYSDSTGLSAGMKYYYRIRAVNGTLASANSNIANVTTLAQQGALPVGWADSDIGPVGLSGSATYSAGTYTVKGAGAGVAKTTDGFNFAYQTLSGDGSITIKLSSIQGISGSFAGVMIRQSTAPNSAHVSLFNNTDNSIGFLRRATSGASNSVTTSTGGTGYWLRLTRSGNTFTAYKSPDGTTWTSIGSASVTMTGSVLIGLACTSTSTTSLATATITNLTVTGTSSALLTMTTFVTSGTISNTTAAATTVMAPSAQSIFSTTAVSPTKKQTIDELL